MEAEINKIDGVTATISFMTQRLTLESDIEDFDSVVDMAQAAIDRVEDDCKIVR